MTCAICHDFRRRGTHAKHESDSREEKEEDKSESDEDEGLHNVRVDSINWDAFQTSSTSCYTCGILVRGCSGVLRQHRIREADITHASINFRYPFDYNHFNEAEVEKLITFHLTNGKLLEIEMFTCKDVNDDVEPNQPEGWELPIRYRTCQQTDSAMALSTIKGWVTSCIVKDYQPWANCEPPERPQLPTRVVDVGLRSGIVRVVETKGLKAKYNCLSHCWGLEPIKTTIGSNLEARKLEIPWDELTKTFQQAITLTKDLGIEYIWIDSLCIIQDSARDWEIESARMAAIYSNSYLTLAATSSHDGRGGLFKPTPDVKVSGVTPEGESYRLFFREVIDHHIDSQGPSSEVYYPLLTRAWVYQERMLSTRLIHFGRHELFFECNSAVECECGYIEFHDATRESQVLLIKIVYADAISGHDAQAFDAEVVAYHRMRLWRTLVSCYTNLSLTKSKDRLPAVGGMARQLSTVRKTPYLAGLWEDSLNEDLLWIVYSSFRRRKPRPNPSTAPSWSWASVDTPVNYWDEILFTTLDRTIVEPAQPRDHYSKVLGVSVSRSAVDEFGSVSRSTLSISGLVVETNLEWGSEVQNGEESFCPYVAIADTRLPVHADYCFDAEGPGLVSHGTSVWCLRMGLVRGVVKENFLALVLRRSSSNTEAFERIGMIKISGPRDTLDSHGGVFHDSSERSVVII